MSPETQAETAAAWKGYVSVIVAIYNEAAHLDELMQALLENIPLQCHRFEFCPEVTAKLCRLGEKIWEVPVSYTPRSQAQGKKLRPSDGWMAIWTLIRFRFMRRGKLFPSLRNEHPPFPVALFRLAPR
jgi:hypothetical protein